MSKEGDPGKLIAQAARAVLAPIGFKRVGRSRFWISDEGYWLIGIEFQPSGFVKGSYLNVGAHWLWYAKEFFSFDYGHRQKEFVEFKSVEQFAPLAKDLAEAAAQGIRSLRSKFSSISKTANELVAEADNGFWQCYHAAICCGLTGETQNSRRLFNKLIAIPTEHEWMREAQHRFTHLADFSDDPVRFRHEVLEIITKARSLRKLPPDPTCLDRAMSH